MNELLILNRNDNLIPGVARLSREQAAAFFMLGETQGTSAGGAAEEGKALRVPGTNPFYPYRDEEQANRFWELMGTHPFDVYLVNTGRVGGPDGDPDSKKLRIEHSGAIVKAIAEETITWEADPDFGYDVASAVPGIDDLELLQPRLLYERAGRADEYARIVERLKRERAEFLASLPRAAARDPGRRLLARAPPRGSGHAEGGDRVGEALQGQLAGRLGAHAVLDHGLHAAG